MTWKEAMLMAPNVVSTSASPSCMTLKVKITQIRAEANTLLMGVAASTFQMEVEASTLQSRIIAMN